ncbi:MAG: carbon-nitrogen hydrolase family protein, partial [Calditrichaeota bacterium]
CWDVSFPAVAQKLAQQGAEIIFLPIWGGIPTLVRARAIENQVYIVTSSYDIESGVFDWEGNLLVQATAESPVSVITLDLNHKKEWPWLGDFKSRIPREQPSRQAVVDAEEN